MLKGLGNLGDMGKMMQAAKDMQEKMATLQEELGQITVEGSAGAGLVTATATAKGDLTGLSVDPSLFKPEDREVVEDLILAAIKDAQARAAERHKEEMGKLTESLGLPADMKLPF